MSGEYCKEGAGCAIFRLFTNAMRIFIKAASLPFAVLVLHFCVWLGTDIYDTFWWADNITHFLGGTAIAFFFQAMIACELAVRHLGALSRFGRQVMVLALTSLAAMGWEFLEWTADLIFATQTQEGLFDTMLDMLMGMLGCLPVLAYLQMGMQTGGE